MFLLDKALFCLALVSKIAACITQRTTGGGANFWVGLARGGDGGFGWVDGTPFDLEFWLDGEPNSSVSDNDDLMRKR